MSNSSEDARVDEDAALQESLARLQQHARERKEAKKARQDARALPSSGSEHLLKDNPQVLRDAERAAFHTDHSLGEESDDQKNSDA